MTRRLCLIILGALLFSLPVFSHAARADVVYDNSASITNANGLTYPLTVGSNSNRALAVFVHVASWQSDTPPTVTSVTYAGVALTQIVHKVSAQDGKTFGDLWTLPAGTQPATGMNNVVVTLSGPLTPNESIHSGAISAYNVNQSTTFTSTGSNDSNSTSATLTLGSSGANDLVIDSVCTGSSITSTPQTARWASNLSGTNACDNEGGATAAGGTTSLSWTVVSDIWIMVGASFKAAAASTATFDNYASSDNVTMTYPVTVGSHSNRALAVFVQVMNTYYLLTPTVNSVTYAGVPLTRIRHQIGDDGVTIGDIWALPAGTQPATGTNNVVVTFSVYSPWQWPNGCCANAYHSGAISAYNVDQTTTFTSTAGNAGTSASATLTLPSSGANDLVIDSVCNGTSITSTPQTAQWIDNYTGGGTCDNHGGATAAGGTTSLSWTVANDHWIMVGGSFKAAAASTATFNSAGSDTSSLLTYPLTVGSNSNRALAVFAHVSTYVGDTPPTISSVTYAGVALSQIVHKLGTDGYSYGDFWALPAGTQPATGINNVVMTLSGPLDASHKVNSMAISAYNVDQTTTFTSTASNAGKSTSATLTLASSGANDLVIDSTCNGTGLTSTPQWQLWIYSVNFNDCDSEGVAWAAGGTTSLSWTGGNDYWIMVGGSFKAAAGSAAAFDNYASNVNVDYPARLLATYPLTVGSSSNRALAVFDHIANGSNSAFVYGITYAGVGLAPILQKAGTDGPASTGDLWALPPGTQPASGANNVVVAIKYPPFRGVNILSGAISASGVDQNTTFTSTNSKAGKSTSANVTLATSDGNGLVIESACTGTLLKVSGQTQLWNNNPGNFNDCGNQGGAWAAGGTTSLTWTATSDYWIMLGASFRAVVKHQAKTY